MFSKHDQLQGYDDELLAAMDAEDRRQEDHIELIASENYASKRVMQAQGGGLTNKYAEGYPGKRYYGGCEHVDMAHVAGLVAAGLYPNPIPFADVVTTTTHKTLRGPRGGLILARANEEIEKKLNSAVFPGAQGGPLMHVIAAKAVCFKEALEPGFKDYQAQVIRNAKAMAEVFIGRGYDVVSGGTDNHLMLISLVKQGLTGKAADAALGAAHITVNKNAVPNDPQSPFVTSGIRIGTPAVTTRGFREGECRELAGWICDILDDIDNPEVGERVRGQVGEFCRHFPVYAD
ncbi:serine hydroxymethyltransferase [Pseudomonas aeruginosa]|uniref:serine hydroxymethyltransferase n=1 Tax=Pseudomonas aeruginosa TaxID=287 RepID=UPI000442EFE1|nr:serine hydroxymethyltransferase [Pseudomonas aeruginosa]AHW71020.1 serine hydroxymethyltransferase [Pseudomonas aeruginosa PA96]